VKKLQTGEEFRDRTKIRRGTVFIKDLRNWFRNNAFVGTTLFQRMPCNFDYKTLKSSPLESPRPWIKQRSSCQSVFCSDHFPRPMLILLGP
jgi:hypothetical protein